jgi:hypothetical protein
VTVTDSEHTRRLKSEAGRRGGSVVSEATRAASAVKMAAVMRRRLAEEPERVSAISSANGQTACSYLYLCTCGRVFRGPSAYYHAKQRGHGDVTRIDNDDYKESA